MMKNNKKMAAVFLSGMMMVLAACGSGNSDAQEDMAPVESEANVDEPAAGDRIGAEEEETGPEEEEAEETEEKAEAAEEEEIQLSYAEENELEFCKDTVFTIQGTRAELNNEEDIELIDAEWVIKSIEMSDVEDGLQTITIRHECTGYLWTDHKTRFMFDISMPSVRYCDLNTGKCFPTTSMSEDGKLGYQTEVEWDGKTYKIDFVSGVEWDDGTEWTPDGKGGNTLPSTMLITDTFVVTEGYDGMGMIVSPLTIDGAADVSYGVHDENEFFIREILEADEGSLLFDVTGIRAILENDGDNSDAGSEGSEDGATGNTENPDEDATA